MICIAFGKTIIDISPPDIIEGNFNRGVLEEIANLTWSKQKFKMETHVKNGITHGMFKFHDFENDKIMVALADRNNLVGNCWIIHRFQVSLVKNLQQIASI